MAIPDQITIDKTSGPAGDGQKIKITLAPNPSTSSRSATFKVKTASGLEKEVTVTQPGRALINVIVGGSGGYIEKLEV